MLSGKVAIVTGASRGIGRETALTLAGYGATVIVNYCGSKDKAEAVVEEITAAGGTAKAYQGDVSDFDVAKEMITSVKKEFEKIAGLKSVPKQYEICYPKTSDHDKGFEWFQNNHGGRRMPDTRRDRP